MPIKRVAKRSKTSEHGETSNTTPNLPKFDTKNMKEIEKKNS